MLRPHLPLSGRIHLAMASPHNEAGLISCLAGFGGFALFYALDISPVWLGFPAGAVPAILIASWLLMDNA